EIHRQAAAAAARRTAAEPAGLRAFPPTRRPAGFRTRRPHGGSFLFPPPRAGCSLFLLPASLYDLAPRRAVPLAPPRPGLMDTITSRAPPCNSGLKGGADKTGRKVKCSKCGTVVTVPARAEDAPVPAVAPAAKKTDDDDDEGPLTYSVKDEPTPAEQR